MTAVTPSIIVVSAGLSVPSSTRLLADRLAASTTEALGDVEIVNIELREIAHELTDHLLTGFPGKKLRTAIEGITASDGIIAVTPVFSASYSGLFKTFFDILEEGTLDGKPVLIAATAGTGRHSLVLEHALRPLFSYLHAVVLPTGVFAAAEDFGNSGLDRRIKRATEELVALLDVSSSRAPAPAPRRMVEDEFANPTPFETLLKQVGVS